MSFVFDKDKFFLLYGINVYSEELAEVLLGTNVVTKLAYIDMRAGDYPFGYNSIPVFLPNQIQNRCESIVIIMLQNAMQHDEVAEKLHTMGFTNIIYCPMKSLYNRKVEKMGRYYNNLVYKKELLFGEIIDTYDEISKECVEKIRIINENDDWCVVYVPFNMIYTALNEKTYNDIPILSFRPYRVLFNWLMNNKIQGDISEYLEKYGVNSLSFISSVTDEDILRRRRMLYDIWERHFYNRDSYFEVGAPIAAYNQKGYFNLTEGQHRVMYQILKGMILIPVRLGKQDFVDGHSSILSCLQGKSVNEMKNDLIRIVNSSN
ncbi:MAG: hypothetical protein K6F86_09040 [Lachnospiraceae bacterium]|nr:hypothetical protein [Lachnospiraceae bacterium]